MEEEGIAYLFVPDPDSQREVMVLVDNNEAYAAVELLATEPLAIVSHTPEALDHESLQRLDWPKPGRYLIQALWQDYLGPVEPVPGQTPFMPLPRTGPSQLGSGPSAIRGAMFATEFIRRAQG
jgi:hypothetical protein